MKNIISGCIVHLHELEDCAAVSPDEAFSLLYLSRETRKQAERLFRQSLGIWRTEATLALKRARIAAIESGRWMHWAWLTWVACSIPFRYYALLFLTECGCAPSPTLLLATQQTSGLTHVSSGTKDR